MKTRPISGFPEWLPEEELVQQHFIDTIRRSFELHGFGPIRTRAMEPMDVLLSKGETDKEIYAVQRRAADADASAARMGLHYDLTVPFARYVRERRGQLTFPFRRYQIQSAWRGERPQLGRYREFLQADADVIGERSLGLRYDCEMLGLLAITLDALPIPPAKLLLNNRKVLQGFYLGLGVDSVVDVLRCIDKIPKIGADKARVELGTLGLSDAHADACLRLARLECDQVEGLDEVAALGVEHPLLTEGLDELRAVLRHCLALGTKTTPVAALHIARGFDYYTGTVVEGVLVDHPDLGSICSGGRYDQLASEGGVDLPGVGVSIGVSRLMGFLAHLELLAPLSGEKKSPADVLVVVHEEDDRPRSDHAAQRLRARGIRCLTADKAQAYGKQIKAATRLGIRYAWFPPAKGKGDAHEVKDLVSGEQQVAELDAWVPTEG